MKDFSGIHMFRDNYPEKFRAEVHLLFKIIDVLFDEQIDSDVEMQDADDAKAKRMKSVREVIRSNGKSVIREHRLVIGP